MKYKGAAIQYDCHFMDKEKNLAALTNLVRRERVCQDDFCKFSKFKYLSAEKSPNISCLHIS